MLLFANMECFALPDWSGFVANPRIKGVALSSTSAAVGLEFEHGINLLKRLSVFAPLERKNERRVSWAWYASAPCGFESMTRLNPWSADFLRSKTGIQAPLAQQRKSFSPLKRFLLEPAVRITLTYIGGKGGPS